MIEIIKRPLKVLFLSGCKCICKVAPYKLGPILAKREYKTLRGHSMNLKNPKNLYEKIAWMQFHADTSLWTTCADKYRVREYVESKGCREILPKLYGHWNKAEDIDFGTLPNSFVLKTNNSCGQNIIVKDKRKLNITAIRKKINNWLKLEYGSHNAQFHYLRIKPCIIAEELLIDPSLKEGENLIDYKIWCFEGEPESILLVSDRHNGSYSCSFYDLEWNNISEIALKKQSKHFGNKKVLRPVNLDKMLEYARRLSMDFQEVRADFYDIDGKIYFGELTFTTGYDYFSDEYFDYLGSKIDLTKVKRIR